MQQRINYVTGGAVQAADGIYLTRAADEHLLSACLSGSFAYVLTSRQLGKSSMMVHAAEELEREGLAPVIVDLQEIGVTNDADMWYRSFLFEVQEQLHLKINVAEWWEARKAFTYTHRFTSFFQEIVQHVKLPIIIFVDEIDTTLSLDFTDDFFAALRSMYLGRASKERLRNLSFVLIGAASPADLIKDPERTPFNIGGHQIDLHDFTAEEALPLTSGLGAANGHSMQVLDVVLYWTAGHPFLTLRVFKSLVERPPTDWSMAQITNRIADLFFSQEARADSNLQFVRDMFLKRERQPYLGFGNELLTLYRKVHSGEDCPDDGRSRVVNWLKLSGIVIERDGYLRVRNRIYEQVFTAEWAHSNLRINWPKRLAQYAAAALAALILIAASLGPYAWVQKGRAERNQAAAEEARGTAEKRAAEAETARREALTAQQNAIAARNDEANQRRIAQEQAKLAKAAEEEARRQRDVTALLEEKASSSAAAAQASLVQQTRPDQIIRSVSLSIEALKRAVAQEDSVNAAIVLRRDLSLLRNEVWRENQPGIISAVASPSGDILVTATERGILSVRNVEDGRLVRQSSAGAPIAAIDLSADGKRLVTGLWNGSILLWGTSTWKSSTLERQGGRPYSVRFSPDGRFVLSLTAGPSITINGRSLSGQSVPETIVRDATSGRVLIHVPVPGPAAFSPRGDRLAVVGEGGDVDLWDITAMKRVTAFRGSETAPARPTGGQSRSRGHRFGAVAFSPDGNLILSSGSDGRVYVWDVHTHSPVTVLNHPEGVSGGLFLSKENDADTPSGTTPRLVRVVTVCGDGAIRTWALPGGELLFTAQHQNWIESVQASPDEQLLVSSSWDSTARVWNANSGEAVATLPHENRVSAAIIIPRSRILTISRGGDIRLWRSTLATQQAPRITGLGELGEAGLYALQYNNERWQVVSRRDSAVVGLVELSKDFNVIASSPTGNSRLLANKRGELRLWNGESGQLTMLPSAQPKVQAAFDRSGRRLLVASGRSASLWESGHTHPSVTVISQEDIGAVSLSPSLIIVGSGNMTLLFNALTGALVRKLSTGIAERLLVDDSGSRVAIARTDDTVHVWNLDTGQALGRVGAGDTISDMAFSASGREIATAVTGADVRIWDTETGHLLAVLPVKRQILRQVRFVDNDRRILVSSGESSSLWYWRSADLITEACSLLPFQMDAEEWANYFPNQPYSPACSTSK
jgi:WD40 repeat protein